MRPQNQTGLLKTPRGSELIKEEGCAVDGIYEFKMVCFSVVCKKRCWFLSVLSWLRGF